jgi:uncharacterized protein (TIGR00255 family)
MTGFGRATFQHSGRAYRIELKAVNGRFLDLRFRLPWLDGELEALLSADLRKALSRGRVDVIISEGDRETSSGDLFADLRLAGQLGDAIGQLSRRMGIDRQTVAMLIPAQKELVGRAATQPAAKLWTSLSPAISEAVHGLLEMRQREGAGLQKELQSLSHQLEEIVKRIAELAKNEPKTMQQRLEDRLRQLNADVEPARLAQEVALLAERSDVTEELARLRIHIEQFSDLLTSDSPVGRKIEFLLQELNREVNTIASKSSLAEVGSAAVDAKAVLEKMREQAQNVE